jgi:hypothetical protein
MKATREEQAGQEDSEQLQQKRWAIEWVTAHIKKIKKQVLRALRWLNNFLNKSQQQYVNKKRV